MTRIGLFYGSSTCYTEIAAEKIRDYFETDGCADVVLHNIAENGIARMTDYDRLILGIPTWDYGELQEDWEDHWTKVAELDLRGKTVALYGLGDQIGYPEWFQDAMGYLHNLVVQLGARVVGYWPREGYQFAQSAALAAGGEHFVGLALDEENEFDESEARIARWCEQLKREFEL